MTDQAHVDSIHAWQNQLNESIRKENGWLALAGLFWLREGENNCGSDPNSKILLPAYGPKNFGVFTLQKGVIQLRLAEGVEAQVNGEFVRECTLRPDTDDNPCFITLGQMQMVVIDRGKKFAVRLWDNQRKERQTFQARVWHPVDEAYRIRAQYVPLSSPEKVFVPDVLGDQRESKMDGRLIFELHSQIFKLVCERIDNNSLFVMFRDETSGHETYPSGRYMIVELTRPGEAIIDFNKAYNPPCAFTDYATCPFAPSQNFLKTRVEAGEKYEHD